MALGNALKLGDGGLDPDVQEVLSVVGEQLEDESGNDYVARFREACQELVEGDEAATDLFTRTLLQRRRLIASEQRGHVQRTLASDRDAATRGSHLDNLVFEGEVDGVGVEVA